MENVPGISKLLCRGGQRCPPLQKIIPFHYSLLPITSIRPAPTARSGDFVRRRRKSTFLYFFLCGWYDGNRNATGGRANEHLHQMRQADRGWRAVLRRVQLESLRFYRHARARAGGECAGAASRAGAAGQNTRRRARARKACPPPGGCGDDHFDRGDAPVTGGCGIRLAYAVVPPGGAAAARGGDDPAGGGGLRAARGK